MSASMSNPVIVAQLNATWWVLDDGAQWILARLDGAGWRPRTSVQMRSGLEHCVRLHAGEVDPAALAILAALPAEYRLGRHDRLK